MAVINGTSGADTLADSSGDDTINGLAGNDDINGGHGGNDVVNGGDGRDSLQFMSATSGVTADFVTGTVTGGGSGTTSFTSIEKLVTGDFNDRLTGNASAQNLAARAGADTLAGGGGIDTLWGGAGNDTFIFRETGTANADSIGDWTSGQDTLLLDAAVMTALGASGDFTAGDARFWASSTGIAHDADDRIIFNSTTRQIFYDADGNGSGAAQLIATLQTGATLVATDIAVEGGTSDQVITGTSGNDSLAGANGNDTINGFGGNDTIVGGAGRDSLNGGAGSDLYVFNVAPGDANADEMHGFDAWARDMIQLDARVMPNLGPSGNFSEYDARFYSAAGATGGHDADDRIIFDQTSGSLYYDPDGSGAAAAQLIARSMPGPYGGNPVFAFQIIVVNGGASGIVVEGTDGYDAASGTSFDDTMNGLAGNDYLLGEDGNDRIDGGDGNDYVYGEVGDDTLIGGAGDDTLIGSSYDTSIGTGRDSLLGGDGNDRLDGGLFVDGGAGVDTLVVVSGWADLGAGTLNAGSETGTIAGIENASARHNSSGVRITGSAGANTLWGANGNDTLDGAGGNDTIGGSSGNDALAGDDGDDELSGDDGDDALAGGDGNDMLSGGYGADALHGGNGADVFDGGEGADTLTGGAGADTVLLNTSLGSGTDMVTDFAAGVDTLRFDGNIFTNIGISGDFSAADGRFHAAAGATQGQDAGDRIVYDTSTGNLYYDADGNGSGSAQLVARLQGAPTLQASDLAVDNGSVLSSGTNGDDSLVGGPAHDSLDGAGGNDTLIGNSGDDTLIGGTGNDLLVGNLGADSMQGGDGDDRLDGVEGGDEYWGEEPYWDWENDQPLPGDTLDGGAGNDVYYAQVNDIIVDSGGHDTVFTSWDYTLAEGLEDLTYLWPYESDGEGVFVGFGGNELDNVITVSGLYYSSSSELDGGDGNDTLSGSGEVTFRFSLGSGDYGHDVLYGDWSGTIDFADARSAIVADLRAGTMTGGGTGGSGSATLHYIGNFIGGAFDDHIVGGAGSGEDEDGGRPQLAGGAGNDTLESGGSNVTRLQGGDGNDRLVAHGEDQLLGGAGADTFVFSDTPGAPAEWSPEPSIGDFAAGTDRLVLNAAFHSGIGSSGNFGAGDERFYAAAGATSGHDATDRVILDTSTGRLYYDADGSGSGEAALIAAITLAPGSGAFTATDIAVERNSPDLFVVGSAGNDTLAGGGGSDTIDGGGGNDSLSGGDGLDTLIGGAGDDTLDGGPGPDFVDGGDGNDTYYAAEGDELSDSGGHDLVLASGVWTLAAGFEDLTMTDAEWNSGAGNELANVMTTNSTSYAALSGAGGNDTIHGGAGAFNDLYGGEGDDLIVGSTATDWISGGSGNDSISSGAGNDEFDIFGGASDGNYGNDTIDGGAGFDQFDFDDSSARSGIAVDLAAGTVNGGGVSGVGSVAFTGIEAIYGTRFDDSIFGNADGNRLYGYAGSDTIGGGAGNDTLSGHWGNSDYGNAHADQFVFAHYGDAHADILIDFSSGTDAIVLDGAAFTAIGPSGDFTAGDVRFTANSTGTAQDASDRVVYNTSSRQLWYDADGNGAGAAQLVATLPGAPSLVATDIQVINGTAPTGQVINGTSGADTLADTAGNTTINGLAGNDTINGGSGGSDVVNGGDGRDTLAFMSATGAVVANFVAGTVTGGGPGTTSFTSIERIITGDFNDTLTGNASAQNLTARSGADTLAGAGGVDTLWGGAGADTFIFREAGTANADTIGDWTSGSDEIALDNAIMNALGGDGDFVAGDTRFWASSTGTAHDANDRVIYNTNTRSLYYDADGTGSGAAQLIAIVQAGATIAATDISII